MRLVSDRVTEIYVERSRLCRRLSPTAFHMIKARCVSAADARTIARGFLAVPSTATKRKALSSLCSATSAHWKPSCNLPSFPATAIWRRRFAHTYQPLVSPAAAFRPESTEVASGGGSVTIRWSHPDRPELEASSFHAGWLRHNCHCEACREPSSGQIRAPPCTLLPQYTVTRAELLRGEDLLSLSWGEEEGHRGVVPCGVLRDFSYDPPLVRFDLRPPPLKHSAPELDYSAVANSHRGLHRWLSLLAERGLVVLRGVPVDLSTLEKVASLIAVPQHLIYGKTCDVYEMENPINAAYSNIELPLHEDLMYYESPPGLQLLHCIKFDSCVTGGESRFLDAFHATYGFRAAFPKHFSTLSTTPATFQKVHYERDYPVHMMYQRPHIQVNHRGEVIGVHWSPPFEGPLRVHPNLVEPYYQAYHKFAQWLQESEDVIEFCMRPGDLISFNNRRVLHSRREFQLNGGQRHLRCAYVNIDEFKSKYTYLSQVLGEVAIPYHVGNSDLQ